MLGSMTSMLGPWDSMGETTPRRHSATKITSDSHLFGSTGTEEEVRLQIFQVFFKSTSDSLEDNGTVRLK